MDYDDFKIGFWHTFGDHAEEKRDKIIERKTQEIVDNGWTLWSFQPRHTINAWRDEIKKLGNPPVFVFCSNSEAKDPSLTRKAEDSSSPTKFCCNGYKFKLDDKWKAIPVDRIKVPHPTRHDNKPPSAFYVQKIFSPDEVRSFLPSQWISESDGHLTFTIPAPQWFSERKGNIWLSESLPTYGETMICPNKTPIFLGKGGRPRLKGYAILELKAPYFAYVGVVPPDELL
jgi:hypothetical protein